MVEKQRNSFLKSKIVKATAIVAGLATVAGGVKAYEQRGLIDLYSDLAIAHVQEPRTIIDFTEATDPNLASDQKVIAAYNKMQRDFGVRNDLLLSSEHGWTYASAWPYGRALEASYATTLIPHIGESYTKEYQKRLGVVGRYWNTDPEGYPAGYDPGLKDLHVGEHLQRYIDDNLWLGVILARDYEQSGNKENLESAKQVFALAVSQWDEKGGGGIFWKEQLPGETERQKSIVSNGTAITLGVDLYQATGNKSYLEWSEKILAWTDDKLRDNVEGIYSDSITGDKVERAKFTYCQGAMVGALTKLSEVNPEKYPLQRALDLANTAMDYFDERGYTNTSFDTVFFQNIFYLAGAYDHQDFTDRTKKSLKKVTDTLSDNYADLSTHASALHLRAMERLGPEEYGRLL